MQVPVSEQFLETPTCSSVPENESTPSDQSESWIQQRCGIMFKKRDIPRFWGKEMFF